MTEQFLGFDDEILRADRIADPYPYLAEIRSNDPVHWNEHFRAWFLHKHEDLFWALRNPAFSSDRVRPVYENRLSPEQKAARKPTFDVLLDWMVFMDPPEHTRMRQLVMPAFGPKAVAAMRPRVAAVVEEAIAAVEDRDSFDMVEDLAYPIPAIVIAELMGVPVEERDLFKAWSDSILVLVFGASSEAGRRERAQDGLIELTDYLRGLIDRYRREPADNLISNLLISAAAGEDPLTDDEIVSTCALLIFGGHETTTNLIANGTRSLLTHPEQWERLKADPSLAPSAVEELLRFDGPSKMELRVLTEDVDLRGKTMRAGDTVYLAQLAANRDPDAFDAPDSLDIGRSPNRHVGFGFGLHHCLGNFLARLEATLAFEAISQRLPDLQISPTQPETWHPTMMSRGMTSFPVVRGRS